MGGTPRIEMLTRDDTFRHLNESPPSGGSPDDPARMVGNGATSGANVALHELSCGDLLVMCSDGVHKYVDVDDWPRVLRQPAPLLRRCEELIALARANGSADDATVLVLRRAGLELARPRWLTRFFGSIDSPGAQR
jgi:protein phosphatase